eukprot:COSAG01_NODE_50_length_31487_cov_90.470243_25_plen_231_part_00
MWDVWDAISSADRELVSQAGMITRGHCHNDGTAVPWFQAAPFVRQVTFHHDTIAPLFTNTLHVLMPPSGTWMEFIGPSGTSCGEIVLSHGAKMRSCMDGLHGLALLPPREEVMGSIASGTSFVAPVTISSGGEWVIFYQLDATATPRAVAMLAECPRGMGCTLRSRVAGFGATVPADAQLLTGPIIIWQAAAAVATQPWLQMNFITGAYAGGITPTGPGRFGATLRSHAG